MLEKLNISKDKCSNNEKNGVNLLDENAKQKDLISNSIFKLNNENSNEFGFHSNEKEMKDQINTIKNNFLNKHQHKQKRVNEDLINEINLNNNSFKNKNFYRNDSAKNNFFSNHESKIKIIPDNYLSYTSELILRDVFQKKIDSCSIKHLDSESVIEETDKKQIKKKFFNEKNYKNLSNDAPEDQIANRNKFDLIGTLKKSVLFGEICKEIKTSNKSLSLIEGNNIIKIYSDNIFLFNK